MFKISISKTELTSVPSLVMAVQRSWPDHFTTLLAADLWHYLLMNFLVLDNGVFEGGSIATDVTSVLGTDVHLALVSLQGYVALELEITIVALEAALLLDFLSPHRKVSLLLILPHLVDALNDVRREAVIRNLKNEN